MVSQLALPLVAILVVHAPTFEVGLLTACETAAFLHRWAAGRRVGGPDAVPLGAHRQRPAPRGPAGIDPARAVPGSPDDLAAVRGRARHRRLHRVLRRGLPVLPAPARRPAAAGRGQRQAAGQRVGQPDRRPEHRRAAHPGLHRALRGAHRRAELPLVGRLGDRHPGPAAQAGAQAGPAAAPRDRRGAAIRPGQPDAARDRHLHRVVQPVQLDVLRRVLRAARARPAGLRRASSA